MANMNMPNMKTIVEEAPNGKFNVWFKYEGVSESFVNDMRSNMESHIYEVHVKSTCKKELELPAEDMDKMRETLIETVKMLDKNAALSFVRANQNNVDIIGWTALILAAGIAAGQTDIDKMIDVIQKNTGKEQLMFESLLKQL